MAWLPGKHFDAVITHARQVLQDVVIVRYDISPARAILDVEGTWRTYRIIVSEIHRIERGVRYAYYVLDQQNQLVHAFDNSPDNVAIKRCYGSEWKTHLQAEVPHQHAADGTLTLTAAPLTFEAFIDWLNNQGDRL